jgi:hypothetical protein
MIDGVLSSAMDPAKTADIVQLRWVRDNVPLVPGPGVARTAD